MTMTLGADLYHLQRLDSEGDSVRGRLAEIATALKESQHLDQARQTLEDAQTQVRKWAVQQRDLELEIQGLTDKSKRSEQRLYSGTVKNPKELADLQAEIAALQRRQLKLEDDLLDAMVERDEAESAQIQAQQQLDEIETLWSVQQADLMAERSELQERTAGLEQERATVLPSIDAGTLATYQNLRRRKGGLAVTQLNADACGGCGVGISPNRKWRLREGEIVYCSNCERIIVEAK
jgi:predicted  nucleic acid-binding Zn-ribbon protein